MPPLAKLVKKIKKPQKATVYVQSDIKKDYVYSPLVTESLRVSSIYHSFADLEEFREFVRKIDDRAGANDMIVTYTPGCLYIKVRCKHTGCVFQHWYKYKADKLGRPCEITAFRNINFNHC